MKDGADREHTLEERDQFVPDPAERTGNELLEDYPWRREGFPENSGMEDLKIGAILTRAREERGMTFEEASQATKIRKRYLEALELDDYGALPDPVYLLGFVRAYANYLGLDGDRLAEEVKRRRARRRDQRQNNLGNLRRGRLERHTVTPGGVSGARRTLVSPSTLLTVLVSLAVVALIIGLLYYVGTGSSL